MRKLGTFIFVLCVLVGCHQTQPQRPSRPRETHKSDTTLITLIQCHQRMAEEADRQVIEYVQKQEMDYAQTELGTWVRKTRVTDEGETPKKNEVWTIRMVIKDLNDKLLEDIEKTYVIQHEELPRGVEDIVSEMHHGEEATLITPWYDAFGQQGTGVIEPFTNLRIEIYLR